MKTPESNDPNQIRYHYNREEREKGLSDYAGRSRPEGLGLFRRNRSLAIIVFDVLILVLLFVIITAVTKGRGVERVFGSFELTVRAVEFDARVLATLTITAREDSEGGDLTVLFRYGTGDESLVVTSLLPDQEGESRVIREALPSLETADRLYVELFHGDAREIVNTRILRE